MQQLGRIALVLALCASNASAQEQTQTRPAALRPAAPASATSGFEPAPVPSHPTAPPDIATASPTTPGNTPLSPGSARLRIGGRVTDYVGVFSGSGR